LPQGYTLSNVLRWTRQLAIAIKHLARIKPEPVVHGDIKPDNILVEAATGDLVLGDCGVAMWQGLKTGLRLAPWLLPDCVYVAPERRLESPGPDSMDLDDETKTVEMEHLIKKVGGGKLDVWSLGVVAYLLTLRKNPSDYTHDQADGIKKAKMKEVDQLATLKDAQARLQTEALRVWPEGNVTEVEALVKVILGTLQRLDGRMSAEKVLELLEPLGKSNVPGLRRCNPISLHGSLTVVIYRDRGHGGWRGSGGIAC
jgi:serine/threonine protein kinase